jgi:hypothetical protein
MFSFHFTAELCSLKATTVAEELKQTISLHPEIFAYVLQKIPQYFYTTRF